MRIQTHATTLGFFIRFWGPNAGLHAWKTSTLLTEPIIICSKTLFTWNTWENWEYLLSELSVACMVMTATSGTYVWGRWPMHAEAGLEHGLHTALKTVQKYKNVICLISTLLDLPCTEMVILLLYWLSKIYYLNWFHLSVWFLNMILTTFRVKYLVHTTFSYLTIR